MTNSAEQPLRKTRSKKHHQIQQDFQPQPVPQPSQHQYSLPSKLLNPNLPRPRTRGSRGSHGSSKDSQDLQANDVPKPAETSPSHPHEKTEKLSFLENLFSEVFAQGCVDNLSKRTRLDFIKEAYDKYSASLEDSEHIKNSINESNEQVSFCNQESRGSSKSQGNVNQWNDEYLDQIDVENRQVSHFALSFESTGSKTDDNKNIDNTSPETDSKIDKPIKLNEVDTSPKNDEITEKGVTNFLLNVKPRRRSIKLNETDSKEKDNIQSNPRFPEQVKDTIPRFPNLIENMSARYIGYSNVKKAHLGHPENFSHQRNPKSMVDMPNSVEPSPIQKQASKEYSYTNQMSGNNNVISSARSHKGTDMNSENQLYNSPEMECNNPNFPHSHFSYNTLNRSGEVSCERDHESLSSQAPSRDAVHYSISSNSVDCGHQPMEKINNCSNVTNICQTNANSAHEKREDYSSSMESNYLTIKRCQEILNQVKENFGEHVKKNPDVFHNDVQYETVDNEGTYCIDSPIYRNNSIPLNEGMRSSSVMDSVNLENRNNVDLSSHSKNYYENFHCYGDNRQNYATNNYYSQEPGKDTCPENFQISDGQASIYLRDGRKDSQNCNENFCATGNSNMRSNESRANEEQAISSHESSHYEAIDQDKIKQFIHSLTGFDAVQRQAGTSRDTTRSAEEYQNTNDLKNRSDQCSSAETYPRVGFPKVSVSSTNYQLEHLRDVNQSFQPQLSSKSRGSEAADLERHQLYSIPQRKEIERMQQDSLNVGKVSFSEGNPEHKLTYQDFPGEVPGGSTPTSHEMSCIGNSETDDNENFKLRKARNKINLVDYKKSDFHDKEEFYPPVGHNNLNYPCECSCGSVCEQVENMNFDQGQNFHFGNTVSEAIHSMTQRSGSHEISQINGRFNCNTNPSDIDFNKMANRQPFTNHVQRNSPNCLENIEADFSSYNENSGFDSEFPVGNNTEEKTAVVKRKYYFMPSDTNEAGQQKYGEGSMSDQSLYKSYIENLIDNSLQSPANEPTVTTQKQGSVLQNQSDVVELETDKAIDLVMNESSCQVDSKLCLEITQRLTDTLVQSHKDIPTPCLVALEEPVYLQQLKKLRWDHLRHIEREVKRLESLERFLDTCGCGHMMYTKNTG